MQIRMDNKKTFSKEFREYLMKGENTPISSSIFALGMAADTSRVTKATRSMSEQPGQQGTPKCDNCDTSRSKFVKDANAMADLFFGSQPKLKGSPKSPLDRHFDSMKKGGSF